MLVLIGTLIRWSLSVRKRAKAMLIKLTTLLDEAKCYEVIRQLRWPDGVICLHCRDRGVTVMTIASGTGSDTCARPASIASMT